MYLKKIHLENIGPIDECVFELPFHEEGNPKPVIIVGENGTGKSILLSFIINALISSKQLFFENTEVQTGKAYKYRSPQYIKSGKNYYFAKLLFENDIQNLEWQLSLLRKDFEAELGYVPNNSTWTQIPDLESNLFWSNYNNRKNELKKLINTNCLLYFPANRFEDPAWLNSRNLNARAEYSDILHVDRLSNRNIIQYSPLRNNQNWLLDVLFDREAFEKQLKLVKIPKNIYEQFPLSYSEYQVLEYSGGCTTIYDEVLKILKIIFQANDNVGFGIGNRLNRVISVMRDGKSWIPSIFQFSTGQALALNLFLAIVRDYDLSEAEFQSLSEVRGIVVIDEIELHLHSNFQYQVLPDLLKLFPKIQFIITSHSPLFILGLERIYGEYGFQIIEMPYGQVINTERFSEFITSFNYYKQTTLYEEEVKNAILNQSKPKVFTEGETDPIYIKTALELLNRQDILEKVDIECVGLQDSRGSHNTGKGSLDNLRKIILTKPFLFERKVLLLYDCDTQRPDEDIGNLTIRAIPQNPDNPNPGIENLLPSELFTVARADFEKRFYPRRDIHKSYGVKQIIEEFNKKEFCKWVCEERRKTDDFEGFSKVIDIFQDFLSTYKVDNAT